jgi:hypothetical protein
MIVALKGFTGYWLTCMWGEKVTQIGCSGPRRVGFHARASLLQIGVSVDQSVKKIRSPS